MNESRQRLIQFMLSVGATESAAILEQSPAVFVKFDKFFKTHLLGRVSAAGTILWSIKG